MRKILASKIQKDKDLPERAWRLTVLQAFLDGSIYDEMQYEFWQERDHSDEYIPMVERAPSVRYGLLKTVVNDSVAFLFAEGRFPSISCERGGEKAEGILQAIIKDTKLNAVMLDAAMCGSVGSVVIWVRVLGSRLFFAAFKTTYLTPTFEPNAPDTLKLIVERYKVKGSVLSDMGYTIKADERSMMFWFQREWDAKEERWFLPLLVSERDERGNAPKPVLDPKNTVTHNLGFVPMVWITNLPGGDIVDGACTFEGAIEDSIEINYQLSQAGRGLKYSSSPTMVLKDDGSAEKKTKHIAGDAIVIPTEGDAKMLEISGDAAAAVIEYVREVRKMALETVGGSRADSDKLSAATSGRAMELMNSSIINLADKLRSSYGEDALLKVLKMTAAITRNFRLVDSDGETIEAVPKGTKIKLVWPRFFPSTADDRQADAIALTTMTGRPVMSQLTAVNSLAAEFHIEDVPAEIAAIAAAPATSQPVVQLKEVTDDQA